MGMPIDVVIIIPRDHELQNFLQTWPYRPAELDSRVFAIRVPQSNFNQWLTVRIDSLHDKQGLLGAHNGCTRIINEYQPRLIILAGTAGVFPGNDATLGDIVWSDATNCISQETIKLNADSRVEFASPTSYLIEAPFPIDFSLFHREWQQSLSARTNPDITFSVEETTRVDESFHRKVRKSQDCYVQRLGTPLIFRASAVYSTNARISDPVVGQSIIELAAPTICEMELAGCIQACNELKVSLVSIRSCSDVVGAKKSDKDSAQASQVVSDACAKFLSLESIQKTIKGMPFSRSGNSMRSGILNQLIDAVENLGDIDNETLAAVVKRTHQEIQEGRVTIFQAAEVLVAALRGICCGCGKDIESKFEPFRSVIAYIVRGLKPGENQEFFLKALEIFVSLGDRINSVAAQQKLITLVSTRGALSLAETRRAVHSLDRPAMAMQLMESAGKTLRNADCVDASQAAMHFSCMLCQKFTLLDRTGFEEAFNQFDAELSKISADNSERSILFGKAVVLKILNEWLTQEDGWLKRAESLAKLAPNTSWLTPTTRVLYLTFLRAYRALTVDETLILRVDTERLQKTPLLYTCNLAVRGVLHVAEASQPLALESAKMLAVVRPDRRHT